MGLLDRFFKKDPASDLERRLEQLEESARGAIPGYEAQFLNRAADLCADVGDKDRALTYYGRAIDAYLRAERYDAAGAVCRKLLRFSPFAVRARCTLAWLSIGMGYVGDARREVADYVEAAKKADQQELAAKQLLLMADATEAPEIRRILATSLVELEYDAAAGEVIDGTDAAAQTLDERSADAERRWAKVLHAALMGPGELKDKEVRGTDPEFTGTPDSEAGESPAS